MRVRMDLDWYRVDDLEPISQQAGPLAGIIADQPELGDPQVTQDLRPDAIIALVHRETQMDISFHRIHPLLLQLVGPQLVQQTDAPAFLVHIKNDPLPLFLHQPHGLMELLATVAAERTQDISRETGRVHPYQHRLARLPAALCQGQMLVIGILFAESDELEIPILGGHIYPDHLLDKRVDLQPILDKVFYGNDPEVELFGDLQQLWQPRHRPILVHDLYQHPGRFKTRQPGQVDRGFRMTRPTQHPTPLCPQREDMPRTAKVLRLRSRVDQRLHRLGTVTGGDAGSTAVPEQVHTHRKGGLVKRGILIDHQLQPELVTTVLDQRGTDQPPAFLAHKIDDPGCHIPGGSDEISFIFTVFIIHDNNQFPLFYGFDSTFYTGQHQKKCLCTKLTIKTAES